ncbi:MAG: ComEC/Rec2 family competence protein [Oscillospiraceae bacterium]
MRKLATAAIAFVLAVYLAHYLIPAEYFLLAAIICGGVGFVAIILRGDLRKRLLLISLSAALGFSLSYVSYVTKTAPSLEISGSELTISARVCDYPRISNGFAGVQLRLIGENTPAVGAVLYIPEAELLELTPGDEISVPVQVKSSNIRYGENYDRYAAENNYLICYPRGEIQLVGRSSWAFLNFPKTIGKNVVETSKKLFSKETSPFVTALLTGETDELYADTALYSAMSRSGILHVVSVSGMHVAFLVGFLQLVVRRKRWASFIGIPLVWLFVPIAGAGPAIVRAAFMQSAVLAAPLFHRENDSITSLTAVFALLLLINPDACASVSLQLSFAAMAGMVLLTPRVNEFFKPRLSKMRKAHKNGSVFARLGDKLLIGIVAAFSSSLGAMAFSTPLAALYFGYVSLISIAVNILVFWAISACFILGYLGCFLGMLWFPLGMAPGFVAGLAAEYIMGVCRVAAKIPYAAVYTEGNLFGAWLILVYIIFALCIIFKRKSGFRPVLPCCLALCSLCTVIIITDLGLHKNEGSFTALDVGQGQGLVITAGEATAVIDCGGKGKLQNAGEITAGYLLQQGRRTLDVLALTHFDQDHVNGAVRLMSRVNVRALLVPPDAGDRECRDDILDFAVQQGVKVYIIEKDTLVTIGDLTLRVYGPVSRREPTLMYLASFGDFDAFITGDADMEFERRFLLTHSLPDTEVFVAGHHGSRHSSGEEILHAARAENAIISSGYNNYGHPTPAALKRFENAGMNILRTDKLGNVTIKIK